MPRGEDGFPEHRCDPQQGQATSVFSNTTHAPEEKPSARTAERREAEMQREDALKMRTNTPLLQRKGAGGGRGAHTMRAPERRAQFGGLSGGEFYDWSKRNWRESLSIASSSSKAPPAAGRSASWPSKKPPTLRGRGGGSGRDALAGGAP